MIVCVRVNIGVVVIDEIGRSFVGGVFYADDIGLMWLIVSIGHVIRRAASAERAKQAGRQSAKASGAAGSASA